MLLRKTIDQYHKDILLQFNLDSMWSQQRKTECLIPEPSKQYLKEVYDSGYGLKVLAREFNMSYTKMRTLFKKLKIPLREGQSVVTEPLKKFRSEKLEGNNPWTDWTSKPQGHNKNMSKGIQGYFIDRLNRKVWLRSTWEFIFAKWLDSQDLDWGYEGIQYKLENGESYRPDFSIYENGKLVKIIEIKGYFKNRDHKAKMLSNEYGIKVDTILDIEKYTEIGYNRERKEWKQLTESKLSQSEESNLLTFMT